MIEWDFTFNAADVTCIHTFIIYNVGNSCTVCKKERSDNYYYCVFYLKKT